MPTHDQCNAPSEPATYIGFRLQDTEPTCLKVTEAHYSLPHVEAEVRAMLIDEHDVFVIMKTVKRIEALPPRPPVKVTEYR